MAFIMVYGMEVYNSALRNHGISIASFQIPISEILLFMVIVMILQTQICNPIVIKASAKIINFIEIRGNNNNARINNILNILVFSTLTVCLMCPMMSLVATLLFKWIDGNILLKRYETFIFNLPMAYFWQILVAGPSSRFIYRTIFS